MADFNIINWLGNRVGYEIPHQTLENIVLERGCSDVVSFDELQPRDKDLLLADVLFYLWSSPTQTASTTRSHGDFTESKGSQVMTDKRNIYRLMMSLYKKWNDPMADLVEESDGGLQWIDEND